MVVFDIYYFMIIIHLCKVILITRPESGLQMEK